MPRFLRLIIWDALFFLVLSTGYAASQLLRDESPSYLVLILTCVVCGAFLAQLSLWGIGWLELIVVGLPALYLALCPLLAPWLNNLSWISISLVPESLLRSSADTLHLAGALTVGFMAWERFR